MDFFLSASRAGHQVSGADFPEIDITSIQSVQASIDAQRPDVVVNCAAFTAVDKCETESKTAFAVNADGVANLGTAAAERGASVVHISTDYVFDGTKPSPYVETDATKPLSVYGASKLEGERRLVETCDRHFILRIAWLYGTRGNNFLKTIRGLAQKRAAIGEPLKVVNDQFGTPTYTMHVCNQVLALIGTTQFGLYHATSEGSCSWFDFASEIVKAYGIAAHVVPCTTAEFNVEFPRSAHRPANSVLENQRLKILGLNVMPPWKQGLKEYMDEERVPQGEGHP